MKKVSVYQIDETQRRENHMMIRQKKAAKITEGFKLNLEPSTATAEFQ